jgi:hypothetical protein
VYHSRPLFHLARSTPLASRRLHHRLKASLRHHARYYPPPASLSSLTRHAVQPVPLAVLTDDLVQRIIIQGCFVSSPLIPPASDTRRSDQPISADVDEIDDTRLLGELQGLYAPGADASDIRISISPLSGETQGMGPSTLVVPGWIRERAAEVLFEDDGNEVEGIPELVLQCISRVSYELADAAKRTGADRPATCRSATNNDLLAPSRRRYGLSSWLYPSPPICPLFLTTSPSSNRRVAEHTCGATPYPGIPIGRNESLATTTPRAIQGALPAQVKTRHPE